MEKEIKYSLNENQFNELKNTLFASGEEQNYKKEYIWDTNYDYYLRYNLISQIYTIKSSKFTNNKRVEIDFKDPKELDDIFFDVFQRLIHTDVHVVWVKTNRIAVELEGGILLTLDRSTNGNENKVIYELEVEWLTHTKLLEEVLNNFDYLGLQKDNRPKVEKLYGE